MELGASGIKELGDAAEAAGLVMDGQAIRAAREYEIAVDNLEDTVGGLKIQIGNALIPILVDAADAFNQLITLNQQIRSTLDNHNEQVTIASKSYEEYVAEIERAAKAAGYQIDAEGNLIKAQRDHFGWTNKVIDSNYLLSKSEYDLQRKFSATAKEAAALVSRDEELYIKTGRVAEGFLETGREAEYLKQKEEELKRVNEDLQRSMDELKIFMAGPLGEENRKFADQQEENRVKVAELTAELDQLAREHGVVREETIKNEMSAGELQVALDKLSDAQDRLSEETDPAKQHELMVEIDKLQEKINTANTKQVEYVDNSKRMSEVRSEIDELNKKYDENNHSATHQCS
jgi:hypothetical protein